jgi:hypothetical protein
MAHPVFAAMLNADPRPRRPGLLVSRHTQPFPMNLVNGLRITTAAEMILSAARDLGVLDLVSWNPSLFTLRAAQARTSRRSPWSTYDPVSLPRRPCDART